MRLSRAVGHALTAVLPTPATSELLRACVYESPGALDWSAWRRRNDGLGAVLREREGLRELMPLLHYAHGHGGADFEPRDLTVLRVAAGHEKLRCRAILPIAAQALDALGRAGIETLVTRGVALSETAYPGPGLRHCHDLDLLVSPEFLDRAGAVLTSIGWLHAPAQRPRPLQGVAVTLVHPTGFPLELHTRLLARSYYDLPSEGVCARAHSFSVGGALARRPSPTDMLIDVCVNAICRARPTSVKWVADAWFTLGEQPPVDWSLLTGLARQGGLALPLAATLNYLANELEAPIPPAPLADLVAIVGQEDALALDDALALAWSARPTSLPRAADRLSAVRLAARVALPSPAYMRATGQAHGPVGLPLAYAMRLLRGIRHTGRQLFTS
jgi:Uncharacterised nucleotidyltransferase